MRRAAVDHQDGRNLGPVSGPASRSATISDLVLIEPAEIVTSLVIATAFTAAEDRDPCESQCNIEFVQKEALSIIACAQGL